MFGGLSFVLTRKAELDNFRFKKSHFYLQIDSWILFSQFYSYLIGHRGLEDSP